MKSEFNPIDVGMRVREARLMRKMTQQQLGIAIFHTKEDICKLETKGMHAHDLNYLMAISDVLGVTINYLILGRKDMEYEKKVLCYTDEMEKSFINPERARILEPFFGKDYDNCNDCIDEAEPKYCICRTQSGDNTLYTLTHEYDDETFEDTTILVRGSMAVAKMHTFRISMHRFATDYHGVYMFLDGINEDLPDMCLQFAEKYMPVVMETDKAALEWQDAFDEAFFADEGFLEYGFITFIDELYVLKEYRGNRYFKVMWDYAIREMGKDNNYCISLEPYSMESLDGDYGDMKESERKQLQSRNVSIIEKLGFKVNTEFENNTTNEGVLFANILSPEIEELIEYVDEKILNTPVAENAKESE